MDNLLFHHLGIVIPNIDNYLKYSIYKNIYKRVYDPLQLSNLALLKTESSIYIELIEPADKRATTYNFLNQRGGGYHHICFIVKNNDYLNKIIKDKKIKIIWGPKPAILFDNKNVVFGYTQNKELIEFILDE